MRAALVATVCGCISTALTVAALILFFRISHAEVESKYVPTPANVVHAMVDLGEIRQGDLVFDLGCGDGRLVIEAVKRGGTGVCVEWDPRVLQRARARAIVAGVDGRIRFVAGDLFKVDLKDADVVLVFLLPELLEQLEPRLRALRPGVRVVSHWYPVGKWPHDEKRTIVAHGRERPLYKWTVRP